MNDEFDPLRKAFEKNGFEWQENDELFESIRVRSQGNLTLYSYGKAISVEPDHPVIARTRGIIVTDDGTIVAYPFDRFFNHFEIQAKPLDFSTAVMLEKFDGTLINVFYANEEWKITTRGSFYPNEGIYQERFDLMFTRLFDMTQLTYFNREYTYMFELISKENRIVTHYDEEFVALIGARSNITFEECSEEQLDSFANSNKIRRPEVYNLTNIDECIAYLDTLSDDFEGIIVRSGVNRLKIKKESYFALARIKMLNDREIFEYIVGKLHLDAEMLEWDEDVKGRIDSMKSQWKTTLTFMNRVYDRIFAEFGHDQKEFAFASNEYPFYWYLFTKKAGKDPLKRIKWKHVLPIITYVHRQN